MKLKTGMAFLGSLAGLGAAAAVYFGLGLTWTALIVTAAAVVVLYIVAAIAAADTGKTTGFGELMRGLLIGLNAGLNGLIAHAILRTLADPQIALGLGIVLGLITYLTVFAPISQSGFYQGIVGWFTWLMPMSWLVVALGLVFLLFSLLLGLVTLFRVGYLRLRALKLDWKTGTIFVKGGLVANLNYLDTAFNMGNFSFVDEKSSSWHIEHEAGHTLNLTSFGSIFHLVGALDENVAGRGHLAFAERIAESNDSGASGANIPMWA